MEASDIIHIGYLMLPLHAPRRKLIFATLVGQQASSYVLKYFQGTKSSGLPRMYSGKTSFNELAMTHITTRHLEYCHRCSRRSQIKVVAF